MSDLTMIDLFAGEYEPSANAKKEEKKCRSRVSTDELAFYAGRKAK